MVEVQRGNVFLTIAEEDIEKYMAKGYSVVDAKTGKVIRQSVPTDLMQLQRAYSEHTKLLEQKDAEIAQLKASLQALTEAGVKKKTPAKVQEEQEEAVEEVSDGWGDWESEEVEEVEEKPKKKKKKE